MHLVVAEQYFDSNLKLGKGATEMRQSARDKSEGREKPLSPSLSLVFSHSQHLVLGRVLSDVSCLIAAFIHSQM